MNFNRELLATMAFEPESGSDVESDDDTTAGKRADTKSRKADAAAAAPSPREAMNGESEQIIRCLKLALLRSIHNISQPEKRRPLNARKDFTIQATMEFKPKRSSASCCGGDAVNVKTQYAYSPGSSENNFNALLNERLSTEPMDDDDDLDSADGDTDVGFTFIDYSPMCYSQLREFFNVDAKTYCDVLLGSRWHSIPTPGKSGAHLFFCGRDWVIKTMNNSESAFLRNILHRYYYHVRDNPYTLLPRFVGHHRLIIGSRKYNFIIMKNVFATPNRIHEKFDLKGSTINRYATQAEKMRATCTQKDLDISSPVHIGEPRRSTFIAQVCSDAEFLKRSHIMDYSLLVGIHVPQGDAVGAHTSASGGEAEGLDVGRSVAGGESGEGDTTALARSFAAFNMTRGATGGSFRGVAGRGLASNRVTDMIHTAPDHRNASRTEAETTGACFTADEGGMASSKVPGLRNELYYLGIIDILQEYNARKHLEHFFVGIPYDHERISCVNPADYASRFIQFVSSIVV